MCFDRQSVFLFIYILLIIASAKEQRRLAKYSTKVSFFSEKHNSIEQKFLHDCNCLSHL